MEASENSSPNQGLGFSVQGPAGISLGDGGNLVLHREREWLAVGADYGACVKPGTAAAGQSVDLEVWGGVIQDRSPVPGHLTTPHQTPV